MSVENPLLSSLRLLALGMSHPNARLSENLPTLLDLPHSAYWSGVDQRDAGEFLTEGLFRSLSVDSSLDLSSFTGQYDVRETCDCGHVLESTEDFRSISVLPQTSLATAITRSVEASDRVSNEFPCFACGSHTPLKSRTLSKLPESLIVTIDRRTTRNRVSAVIVNIADRLRLPDSSGTLVEYRVSSSVEFKGDSASGHYFSKVRNTNTGGVWTKYDDACVPANALFNGPHRSGSSIFPEVCQ